LNPAVLFDGKGGAAAKAEERNEDDVFAIAAVARSGVLDATAPDGDNVAVAVLLGAELAQPPNSSSTATEGGWAAAAVDDDDEALVSFPQIEPLDEANEDKALGSAEVFVDDDDDVNATVGAAAVGEAAVGAVGTTGDIGLAHALE